MTCNADQIFALILVMIVVDLVVNIEVAVKQGTLSHQVVQRRIDHVPKMVYINVARGVFPVSKIYNAYQKLKIFTSIAVMFLFMIKWYRYAQMVKIVQNWRIKEIVAKQHVQVYPIYIHFVMD